MCLYYVDFFVDIVLVFGMFVDLLKLFVVVGVKNEDGYMCLLVCDIVVMLQQNFVDLKGLNCFVDFVCLYLFVVGIESDLVLLWVCNVLSMVVMCVLLMFGVVLLQFVGKLYEWMLSYVMVMVDMQVNLNDCVYVFYCVIKCYVLVGVNECGGKEVLKSMCKCWFDMLKIVYLGSLWVQKFCYYW